MEEWRNGGWRNEGWRNEGWRMKVRVASKMRQSVNEVIKETTTKMEKQSNDETPTHKTTKNKPYISLIKYLKYLKQNTHPTICRSKNHLLTLRTQLVCMEHFEWRLTRSMSLSFPETNVSPGESNVLGSIARADHWQPQCEDELQSKKKITIVM